MGKVPDPKSQVEQITIALIYKFMDDMDAESEELGGKRKFFTGNFATCRMKSTGMSLAYAVADHVVDQLKQHGDPWKLSEEAWRKRADHRIDARAYPLTPTLDHRQKANSYHDPHNDDH